MSNGITCKVCLGRIDEFAFETRKKIHDRLRPGQPFTPPLLCSDCTLEALLRFANSPDDDDSSRSVDESKKA